MAEPGPRMCWHTASPQRRPRAEPVLSCRSALDPWAGSWPLPAGSPPHCVHCGRCGIRSPVCTPMLTPPLASRCWWFVVWPSWWTLTLISGASSVGTMGPANCVGVPVALCPPQPWVVCLGGYGVGPAVALSAFSSHSVSPAGSCPGLSPLNGVPSSPALQCPGCVRGWLCALQACSPISGV